MELNRQIWPPVMPLLLPSALRSPARCRSLGFEGNQQQLLNRAVVALSPVHSMVPSPLQPGIRRQRAAGVQLQPAHAQSRAQGGASAGSSFPHLPAAALMLSCRSCRAPKLLPRNAHPA